MPGQRDFGTVKISFQALEDSSYLEHDVLNNHVSESLSHVFSVLMTTNYDQFKHPIQHLSALYAL